MIVESPHQELPRSENNLLRLNEGLIYVKNVRTEFVAVNVEISCKNMAMEPKLSSGKKVAVNFRAYYGEYAAINPKVFPVFLL